jgi:hypothetical protein
VLCPVLADDSGCWWRLTLARYTCKSSSTLEVTFSGSNAILPERDKQFRTYHVHTGSLSYLVACRWFGC